jgi:RNA polymerase-binding transcription factor DksA
LLERRANLGARLSALEGVRTEAANDAARARVAPDSEIAVALEMTETLETQFRGALDDIDAALARVDDDRFDHCASCGDHISIERLHILPQTQHCIRCRSRRRG